MFSLLLPRPVLSIHRAGFLLIETVTDVTLVIPAAGEFGHTPMIPPIRPDGKPLRMVADEAAPP